MNYLIWVDDERPVHSMYEALQKKYADKLTILIFKNALDTIDWLTEHHYDTANKIFIDLDHDLGSLDLTGYTICKYIVQNEIPIAGFAVHSANPVGCKNMRDLLIHYGYKPLHYRTEVVWNGS